MNILYINYLYGNDGSMLHARGFANAVRDAGHSLDCLFHNQGNTTESVVSGQSASSKSKLSSCITYCKRILTEPNLFFKNFKYLPKELKQLRSKPYDVMVVRYSLDIFSFIVASRITRTPIVLEVNSPIYYERTKVLGHRHYTRLSGWLEKKILSGVDHVVTVSEELRQYFVKQGLPAEKISTVINGFEVNSFYPRPKSKLLMDRLGIPSDAKVIGFSGSFKTWHGAENAIEILARVQQEDIGRNTWLVLVGDGPDRARLETLATNLGLKTVVFCGAVPHEKVPDYLALFDVALAPYPQLDFFYFSPLKIFEYMAMGIPTVASYQGQIPMIIRHGETGLLIEPGDFEAGVVAILELLRASELRTNMGQLASDTAHANFGWEKNARAYLDIISRLGPAVSDVRGG